LPLNLTSDNAVAEEDDKPKRIVPVKSSDPKAQKGRKKNKFLKCSTIDLQPSQHCSQ
jgi:hypothetical protein